MGGDGGASIYSIGSWPWLTEVWPRSWRGEEAENEEEEEEEEEGDGTIAKKPTNVAT